MFLWKLNNTDKPLPRPRGKREKTQIAKIRNEWGYYYKPYRFEKDCIMNNCMLTN